jgi:NADPH:quinone reductase-like Zn-dependent oxidoreductase
MFETRVPDPEAAMLVEDPPTTIGATTMKAIVHDRYGRPDVLQLRDVEAVDPADDQVLVRVHASSVNPVEWYGVTGPIFARVGSGLRRPTFTGVGADLAGRVEAVGAAVDGIRPGDEVYGVAAGAWAEYACARAERIGPKPASLSFEEAAAVPIAAVTALQALRDKGRVERGQRVLINGASGGVGTFAVQLARVFGAEVTAVCSTGNVELAASLGADTVVDYTREDFTRLPLRHDLMLDIVGSRSFLAARRVLTPGATVVLVGGRMTYRGLGPLPHLLGSHLKSKGRSQTAVSFLAKVSPDDLAVLAELVDAGTIRPVIDRRYALEDAAEALTYFGEGHAKGKVVVTI